VYLKCSEVLEIDVEKRKPYHNFIVSECFDYFELTYLIILSTIHCISIVPEYSFSSSYDEIERKNLAAKSTKLQASAANITFKMCFK
jgi:hypothetical protein